MQVRTQQEQQQSMSYNSTCFHNSPPLIPFSLLALSADLIIGGLLLHNLQKYLLSPLIPNLIASAVSQAAFLPRSAPRQAMFLVSAAAVVDNVVLQELFLFMLLLI